MRSSGQLDPQLHRVAGLADTDGRATTQIRIKDPDGTAASISPEKGWGAEEETEESGAAASASRAADPQRLADFYKFVSIRWMKRSRPQQKLRGERRDLFSDGTIPISA